MNTKAAAWNAVGGMFWTHGRVSARPSGEELALFTRGVAPGDRVVLIGASTRELAERLQEIGADLTVLDFSERMCADLRAASPGIEVICHDILEPATALAGSAKWVLSDRLVNRFDATEAVHAVGTMMELLQPEGVLRATIKLGLYPMDDRMIAEGERLGTLSAFWDESSRTIDFATAGEALSSGLLAHGDIPREVLLEWYQGRGRETRLDAPDVTELFARCDLEVKNEIDLPDAPGTSMFEAVRRMAS
ncbi:hypothetical protein [Nocardioides bruguierae]|uniref:Uncharacterized protein n=1 Tax=Nocardioides bruguierae TaxID=2945102 RepID=A0A9X2DB68_9ACTN|nr:hypothetical protein [Nocardioides bruguierae]MCM0622623.1 hypothetical protein [Nocardioides bruguierae]